MIYVHLCLLRRVRCFGKGSDRSITSGRASIVHSLANAAVDFSIREQGNNFC